MSVDREYPCPAPSPISSSWRPRGHVGRVEVSAAPPVAFCSEAGRLHGVIGSEEGGDEVRWSGGSHPSRLSCCRTYGDCQCGVRKDLDVRDREVVVSEDGKGSILNFDHGAYREVKIIYLSYA